jgi:hypothetical protein
MKVEVEARGCKKNVIVNFLVFWESEIWPRTGVDAHPTGVLSETHLAHWAGLVCCQLPGR